MSLELVTTRVRGGGATHRAAYQHLWRMEVRLQARPIGVPTRLAVASEDGLTTESSALAKNLRTAFSRSSLSNGSMSVEREGLYGCVYVTGGDAEVTEDDGVTIGARPVVDGQGMCTSCTEIYTARSRRRCWTGVVAVADGDGDALSAV